MNRLTKRGSTDIKETYFANDLHRLCDMRSDYCQKKVCDRRADRSCPYLRCMDRLAAYEDTGMTPEQIRNAHETLRCFDDIGIKRGNEIVTAEAEGRLVVLPCKIGDTVWVTGTGGVMKCEIDEACFERDGLVFMVSFNCEKDWTNYYEACKGCPFNSWHQDYSGEWSCDGEWGRASIKGSDFGKTVFLTREEAEKALTKEAEK